MQRIAFGRIRSFAELLDRLGVGSSVAKIGCAASRRHCAYSGARGRSQRGDDFDLLARAQIGAHGQADDFCR